MQRQMCPCVPAHQTHAYVAMHIQALTYFVAISGFRPRLVHFNSLSTYTIQSSLKLSKYRGLCAREKEGGEGREGDVVLCNKSQLKGSLYINSAL